MIETLIRKTPKANKPHKCSFCYGIIEKGENYTFQTNKCEGDLYTWKSHLSCDELAGKLKMFDYADEGVTDEFFIETVKEEYRELMRKTNLELYESKDYVIPMWQEQLKFVKEFHLK